MRLSSSKSDQAEFKTLDGGHVISIQSDDRDLAPLNQPCILAIRPEHVDLRNETAMKMHWTRWFAKINFAGATSSIKLDANGLLLEALTLEADGLSAGDRCTVVLPPDRISLLKND